MAFAAAAGFSFSTFSIAADFNQFVGKNLNQNRDLVASQMKGRNYVVEVDQMA